MTSSEAIKFILDNEQFTDITMCASESDERPVTRQGAIKELTELDIRFNAIDMRTTRARYEELVIYIKQ